jgi:hypothetical protein
LLVCLRLLTDAYQTLTWQTGGNAFKPTMEGDIGEQGTCTTCAYTEGMHSRLLRLCHSQMLIVSKTSPTIGPPLCTSSTKTGLTSGCLYIQMLSWVSLPPLGGVVKSILLMYSGYEGQDAENIKGGMTIYYTQKDFNTSDLEHYTTAFPPVSLITVQSRPVQDEPTDTNPGIPNDRWQPNHRHS